MEPNQQVDEAWKSLGDEGLHRTIEQKRAAIQQAKVPALTILVAHVTVGAKPLS